MGLFKVIFKHCANVLMYHSKNNTDMTNPKSFLNASSLLCFSYFLRINCSPEKKSVENKSRIGK